MSPLISELMTNPCGWGNDEPGGSGSRPSRLGRGESEIFESANSKNEKNDDVEISQRQNVNWGGDPTFKNVNLGGGDPQNH